MNIARRFFQEQGFEHFELVTADGALEAAPAMGCADIILDLVSTGTTLKENNLKVSSATCHLLLADLERTNIILLIRIEELIWVDIAGDRQRQDHRKPGCPRCKQAGTEGTGRQRGFA